MSIGFIPTTPEALEKVIEVLKKVTTVLEEVSKNKAIAFKFLKGETPMETIIMKAVGSCLMQNTLSEILKDPQQKDVLDAMEQSITQTKNNEEKKEEFKVTEEEDGWVIQ